MPEHPFKPKQLLKMETLCETTGMKCCIFSPFGGSFYSIRPHCKDGSSKQSFQNLTEFIQLFIPQNNQRYPSYRSNEQEIIVTEDQLKMIMFKVEKLRLTDPIDSDPPDDYLAECSRP
jgi:hypothetical protein